MSENSRRPPDFFIFLPAFVHERSRVQVATSANELLFKISRWPALQPWPIDGRVFPTRGQTYNATSSPFVATGLSFARNGL